MLFEEGVQLNTPVSALMSAPVGAPTKLNVSGSVSVAVAVKLSVLPTLTDLSPIGSSTGAVFSNDIVGSN